MKEPLEAGPAKDPPDSSDVHEETPGRYAMTALVCYLHPCHLWEDPCEAKLLCRAEEAQACD